MDLSRKQVYFFGLYTNNKCSTIKHYNTPTIGLCQCTASHTPTSVSYLLANPGWPSRMDLYITVPAMHSSGLAIAGLST